MNQDKVIKKIELLRQLEPSKQQLFQIKKGVFNAIGEKERRQKMRFSFFATLCLATIIFFLFAFLINMDLQISNSNAYSQAKTALSQTQKKLSVVDMRKSDELSSLLATTALANDAFSQLHLQGEKGKYSKKECKALYERYYKYLSNIEAKLKQNPASLTKNKSALEQVGRYKNQAEQRLTFYQSVK